MKPIAAGLAPGASRNADVAALLAAGNLAASVSDINPYSFAPAIAPHLAAAEAGVVLELESIAAAYARLAAQADVVVVEGAGGTLVPLSASCDMLDVPARLNLPVLLVVGIRLGCLNHALLSALAINARGLTFAGWIANRIDPEMLAADDNIGALAARLPAPLVADLSFCPGKDSTTSLPESVIGALALVR
jgi:dethiobiotin synthetase